jgi:hypothetical protein
MGAMDTLTVTRDALALIPGVASCKVGMEDNISPSDYPLIRLVPSTLTPGAPYGARTIDTLITFGAQVTESEGLETVYAALFDLELAIREAVRALGGRYLTTVTDQDALPFVDGRPSPYKLMAVRVELREAP